MSIRLVSYAAVGALAVGLAVAAAGEAKAQANVLKECGTQYQAAKAANELKGQSWQDFLKACRVRLSEQPAETAPAAAAPAPTPAPPPPLLRPPQRPSRPRPGPRADDSDARSGACTRADNRRQAGQARLRRQGRPDRPPEKMRRRMEVQEGRAAEGRPQGHLAEILERVQQAPQSCGRVKPRPLPPLDMARRVAPGFFLLCWTAGASRRAFLLRGTTGASRRAFSSGGTTGRSPSCGAAAFRGTGCGPRDDGEALGKRRAKRGKPYGEDRAAQAAGLLAPGARQ